MSEKNNTVNDLRDLLFETIRGVKDGKLDVSKAKAVSDVANAIISSAKVEVDFLRVTGSKQGSGFIPTAAAITHRLSPEQEAAHSRLHIDPPRK